MSAAQNDSPNRWANPFPGMNPYLEQRMEWHSFHSLFMSVAAFEIGDQLPDQFFIRIEKELLMRADLGTTRSIEADISFVDRDESFGPNETEGVATSTAPECVTVPLHLDEVEDPSTIRIYSRQDEPAVTVIELLSYSNKEGDGLRKFVDKRRSIMRSDANYIEIDLLRFGTGFPIARRTETDYAVTLSEPVSRQKLGFWPIELRDPLPTIPIPLPNEQPIDLPLGSVLNSTFQRMRFGKRFYGESPEPRLREPNKSWAEAIAEEHLRDLPR